MKNSLLIILLLISTVCIAQIDQRERYLSETNETLDVGTDDVTDGYEFYYFEGDTLRLVSNIYYIEKVGNMSYDEIVDSYANTDEVDNITIRTLYAIDTGELYYNLGFTFYSYQVVDELNDTAYLSWNYSLANMQGIKESKDHYLRIDLKPKRL